MAIQATGVYRKYGSLYDREARDLWRNSARRKLLPNLHYMRTTQQSMSLNTIRSGAIIVASSGMCTGGRIKHHLKNNVWRKECHIIVTGFMARGTPGRALVDGARSIRLWGEAIRVAATVHTIGGLSAHADQAGLRKWFGSFEGCPQLILVHGESRAATALQDLLARSDGVDASVAVPLAENRPAGIKAACTRPLARGWRGALSADRLQNVAAGRREGAGETDAVARMRDRVGAPYVA